MRKLVLSLLLLAATTQFYAQNYKFGKVSEEELKEKIYPLDSAANAAFLYKKRETSFNYIQGKGFVIETEIHERIKIYNKEGYEWATKKIRLYAPKSGNKDDISIKDAETFVLEGGKIKSYKLDKKDIFNEQYNKYWSDEKFTMPNVTDGCVVEWRYITYSPYTSIDKVELQLGIPIKRLECRIGTPEYYLYNTRQIGYEPIEFEKSSKASTINLMSVNRSSPQGIVTTSETVYNNIDYTTNIIDTNKDNIPALYEEPFVNNIDNYRTALYFELSAVNWPNEPVKYYSKDWGDVSETLMKEEEFGSELKKDNYFEADLAGIISSNQEPEKLMQAIYAFVKEKVKWNKYRGIFTDQGVKDAYKKGLGNTADINLMLVAMLRSAKLNANPLILSTRDHGIPLFPTINGFNYVIAAVDINDKRYLLDATDLNATPNVLPMHALNYQGRIIKDNKYSEIVDLDKTEAASTSTMMVVALDKSANTTGFVRNTYQNLHGLEFRNTYGNASDETLQSKIAEKHPSLDITEIKLVNKEDVNLPILENFKFSASNSADVIGNKIYFKPLFFNGVKKNPFKLEKREFPIDFGTASSYTNRVSITIPEGYSIESMPEAVVFALSDNLGTYKYQVVAAGESMINVYSLLQINSAIIPSEKYNEIRDFYKGIVTKNLEQVVLVKKEL